MNCFVHVSSIYLLVVEVCAGAGGLSFGFHKNEYEIVLLNEINSDCCETLRKNYKDVNIEQKDMIHLDLNQLENIDILIGGVPCQSFSLIGLKKGLKDDRGKLMIEFNRLIKECNPKMFLIENVKGLKFHNKGETLKALKKLFSKDKQYNIYDKVLHCNDYNIAQNRERLFILGVRKDMDKIESIDGYFPPKNENKLVLKDVLIDVPKSQGNTYSSYKKSIFDLVPQGGCWVDLPSHIQDEYCGTIKKKYGGSRGVARRLHMDKPCVTILTTPSQKMTERIHPLETRPLTIRESARIQSFPDDYVFHGSISSQYKQIGNAVPPNLSFEIAKHLKPFLCT